MEAYSVVSIVCPGCGIELEPGDDVCHQCGAQTSSGTEPNAAAPPRLMDRTWLLVVVLLHLGVLGIPLYWRTKYSTRVRLAIIGVSIAYTLFIAIFAILVLRFVVNAVQQLR